MERRQGAEGVEDGVVEVAEGGATGPGEVGVGGGGGGKRWEVRGMPGERELGARLRAGEGGGCEGGGGMTWWGWRCGFCSSIGFGVGGGEVEVAKADVGDLGIWCCA